MKIAITTAFGTYRTGDLDQKALSEHVKGLRSAFDSGTGFALDGPTGTGYVFGPDVLKNSIVSIIPTPGQPANNSKD